jgi:hypothetical protein
VRQSLVIRMDDPGIAARTEVALAALVGAGLLSAATRDALLALGDAPAGGGGVPTVRLEKGYPVPRSGFVVLNSGDYPLDALVECARADAPNISYCAFLCALILEIEQ